MIRKAFLPAAVFAFTLVSLAASAQDNPVSKLDKQLSRIDFAVSADGILNKSVSGNIIPPAAPNAGTTVQDAPSNTVGALVTIRYIAKPLVGLEFNYGYARYTQNFSTAPGGVQAQVNEYTVGYVVTPVPTILGFKPFASVGAGSQAFKPTPRGGQGLLTQARATYYYSVGVQQEFLSPHFGVRAAFRQNFFLAPDFGQNYLTIKQRTISSEPTIGFYLKF